MASDNYGFGFPGFQNRIEAITDALGGDRKVRLAVGEYFKGALMEYHRSRRTTHDWQFDCWTKTSERDFDHVGRLCEGQLAYVDPRPVLASAMYGGAVLELRAETCSLQGDGYRLTVGLISDMTVYDYQARGDVKKWSPFLTDTGAYVIYASAYAQGNGGGMKSVSTRSLEAGQKALRKLMERHFKVTFIDNKEP